MDLHTLADWLRLQGTSGIGPRRAAALLQAFGSPAAVFSQAMESLCQWVPPASARALRQPSAGSLALAQHCLDWWREAPGQRRILTASCPDFPARLLGIADPPLILYAIGPASGWEQHWLNPAENRCLAVVGSRNPCAQGAQNARLFSRELAGHNVTIVSGLALGIDGAAHTGALEASRSTHPATPCTIAVVGTGPDRVYPSAHGELARQIAQAGLLIGEYPPGTGPLAAHFPQRNRLIAGLSQGTLVVQATLQSGSLITAQLALDEGRDVLAIPGSIHSPQSKGCHALIRQGAQLVDCTQDILDAVWPHAGARGGGAPAGKARGPAGTAPPVSVSAEALQVVAALGFDVCTLDDLQQRSGLATANLQVALTELELAGQVCIAPGGRFQRLVPA